MKHLKIKESMQHIKSTASYAIRITANLILTQMTKVCSVLPKLKLQMESYDDLLSPSLDSI